MIGHDHSKELGERTLEADRTKNGAGEEGHVKLTTRASPGRICPMAEGAPESSLTTILIAGFSGACAASLLGRERTRIDNFLVGGLFTGLMAFRDPQANAGLTIAVAAVEGAMWGGADRLVPAIKHAVVPQPKSKTIAQEDFMGF